VVGCAAVSKEDCLVTDWFEIGRLDGMQGTARTALQNRAKACLEHGVNADRRAYYQGHDEGLKYYCTAQKGFELGRKGLAYKSVCPLQLEKDFRLGYQKGQELFQYESKIASLQRRLKKIERKISKKEEELYSDNLSDDQRTKIRSDLKSLDLKYRDVSRELKYMGKTKPMAKVY
jgi:hypothetical protein